MYKGLSQPSRPPLEVQVWNSLLCDVSLSSPQAKSQQDKRMWILHLKRLILENHPAKIPAKVRAARLLTARSRLTHGVNTDFEWDVLEMSLPLSLCFFLLLLHLHLSFPLLFSFPVLNFSTHLFSMNHYLFPVSSSIFWPIENRKLAISLQV